MAAEPAGPGTLSIADRGFAIYRTVPVAAATGQHVLLRLDARHVPALLGRRGLPQAASGSEWAIGWAYRPHLACDATLPCPTVLGRVLYVQVRRRGFRPRPLSLFTTLTERRAAPLAELVALYLSRWQVEVRSRDLKTTLGLEYFDVRSSAMFAKELEVGLLAYTLIRLAMLAVAPSLPAACAPVGRSRAATVPTRRAGRARSPISAGTWPRAASRGVGAQFPTSRAPSDAHHRSIPPSKDRVRQSDAPPARRWAPFLRDIGLKPRLGACRRDVRPRRTGERVGGGNRGSDKGVVGKGSGGSGRQASAC